MYGISSEQRTARSFSLRTSSRQIISFKKVRLLFPSSCHYRSSILCLTACTGWSLATESRYWDCCELRTSGNTCYTTPSCCSGVIVTIIAYHTALMLHAPEDLDLNIGLSWLRLFVAFLRPCRHNTEIVTKTGIKRDGLWRRRVAMLRGTSTRSHQE
jgi:hypothetical protein